MNTESFEMVAKTLRGLEAVLATELREMGAQNVMPGNRMVSFEGDLEMLYKANLRCRTALRILKPVYKFTARNTDELYDAVKDFDWGSLLDVNQSFSIDTVSFGEDFPNSRFVTYRVKDAIVDWFTDRLGRGHRPRVSLEGADLSLNVHITGRDVTISLDSSGESLHRRGYRQAQTEAPISEVLAAGIILMTGWRGETPFVDPMCGSGTFLVEAALIASNTPPGIFRKGFAFETWKDFDAELLEKLYNDDSAERPVEVPILGFDISRPAVEIAISNAKGAGMSKYITVQQRDIADWTEAPQPAGVLVTNPPYGERISAPDMEGLYQTIGNRFKNVFRGYHCWVIGYRDEYFHEIGLAPSEKISLNNGGLDCELREYVIFEGNKREFRASGGRLKKDERPAARPARGPRPDFKDRKGSGDAREPRAKRGFKDSKDFKGSKDSGERRPFGDRKPFGERKPFAGRRDDRDRRPAPRREGAYEGGEAREHREHRPLDLNKLGRRPSIPAEKEIKFERPMWRRKKKEE